MLARRVRQKQDIHWHLYGWRIGERLVFPLTLCTADYVQPLHS